MNALEITTNALQWRHGKTIALVQDDISSYGLCRRKYVSLDRSVIPDPAEFKKELPADAVEVSTMNYDDEHGHHSLAVFFKTPASIAGARATYVWTPQG